MHTVTKVLVVFAAILCVLLAALTMAYSVNADRITADYQNQVKLRASIESTHGAQLAAARDLQAQNELTVQKLNSDMTQLNNEIASLQAERQKLLQDVANANNARDAIVNQTGEAVAVTKTQALLIQQYRDEVTKLRDNELTYRKRETELVDRINDLESQNEVHAQSIRMLQENLADAHRTLQGGGTSIGSAGASVPFPPTFPVVAKIVETRYDAATNKPVATINVGTNNQIRKDMLLMVVRGDQFLANFKVTRADLQWAEGEVDMLGRSVAVQPGDTVRSAVTR